MSDEPKDWIGPAAYRKRKQRERQDADQTGTRRLFDALCIVCELPFAGNHVVSSGGAWCRDGARAILSTDSTLRPPVYAPPIPETRRFVGYGTVPSRGNPYALLWEDVQPEPPLANEANEANEATSYE